MRLARNRHKLTALKNAPDSHLTIAAAVALVGKPKPERPRAAFLVNSIFSVARKSLSLLSRLLPG
jgi:hypothetical protein